MVRYLSCKFAVLLICILCVLGSFDNLVASDHGDEPIFISNAHAQGLAGADAGANVWSRVLVSR